jgi:GNAT superfamily N-acetyltransferase
MDSNSVPTVRRALPADAHRLAQLRYTFRVERAPAVEGQDAFIERCVPWIASSLASEQVWRAYVVDDASVIVGNIWMQIIEKMPNPVGELERHAYVTNFFVQPDYQNRGHGSRLLTALLADCELLGVDATFLWPTARASPLYERHGFSSHSRVLVRTR